MTRKRDSKYYERNKEKIKQRRLERMERDPEYAARLKQSKKLSAQKHYQKNREKILNRVKSYAKENSEKIVKRVNRWQKENPEKTKVSKKRWIENNPEYARLYHIEKIKNDVQYKIRKSLRNRLGLALKRVNVKKVNATFVLLGCSIEFFIEYFKEKFEDGMTWDNHGEWHIDHIIPCSLFDLTDIEQQKVCFHYTNLQPLWASDNISKKDMLPEEWEARKARMKKKNDT